MPRDREPKVRGSNLLVFVQHERGSGLLIVPLDQVARERLDDLTTLQTLYGMPPDRRPTWGYIGAAIERTAAAIAGEWSGFVRVDLAQLAQACPLRDIGLLFVIDCVPWPNANPGEGKGEGDGEKELL